MPCRALELLLTPRALNGSTDIKFVNTSLHGVGHVFVDRCFEDFGLKPFTSVKEQQHPDPEFPSVKFPNPEEAGMTHYIFHNLWNCWTDRGYAPFLGALVHMISLFGVRC
jgi:hypothetical protein